MKRLTYDFEIGGVHCWQVEGADNLVCREVCEMQENDNGCKTCPIARAFDRLAAIEDILGDEYELGRLRELVEADREGRLIVFQPGYTVVSTYQPKDDDGLFIKHVSGVISEEEYKSISAKDVKGEQHG